MIFGIGCDLCAISRMEKSLSGPHGAAFARRVFGPAERAALALGQPDSPALTPRRAASAAADFAAKGAFLKAAGTGLAGPFPLAEIEAVGLDSGAPAYRFSGRTAEWVARRHLSAHLTLSHDGGMAMAFCLLEAAPDAS